MDRINPDLLALACAALRGCDVSDSRTPVARVGELAAIAACHAFDSLPKVPSEEAREVEGLPGYDAGTVPVSAPGHVRYSDSDDVGLRWIDSRSDLVVVNGPSGTDVALLNTTDVLAFAARVAARMKI